MTKKRTKAKSIWMIAASILLSGFLLAACGQSPAKEVADKSKDVPAADTQKEMPNSGANQGKDMQTADSPKETPAAGEKKDMAVEDTMKMTDEVNFDSYVEKVSKLVQLNWMDMDQVWPTYDYTNHNFVIFYLDETGETVKAARVLNVDENRKLDKEEYAGITPPNPAGYDQIEFEGKPSIVMSVDNEVMKGETAAIDLYKTATHEMVHFYYQKDVKASADSSRSQIYPVESAPRIVRQMLYARLIEAVENPDKLKENLGKARFWLDKYHADFKREADSIRATDIAEGTARYTENMGMLIGMDWGQEYRRNEADSMIEREQIFIAADKESYEIGYVAAFLLDEISPNWKDGFYATGQNVEEVLLEKVSPINDQEDQDIAEKITKEVDAANANAQQKLKNVIAAKDDVNIPLLHLDVSKGSKSFYTENMFKYQNLSVMAGYTSKFNVQGKTIEINNTAIISGYEEADQYIRIPLTMKYELKDGRLTIDAEGVKADGIPVQTGTEDGRTIYSAEISD